MREIGHYIGGAHVPGTSGNTGPVYNPASGEQTARVAMANAAEVDRPSRRSDRLQIGLVFEGRHPL